MSRTLYIHVGPRKTATTTIQNFLSRHDNSVVIYPKVGLHPEGSHHNLVFTFFGEEHRCVGTSRPRGIRKMFREIGEQVASSDLPVVISSEEIAPRDVGKFINALLPHVGSEPQDVEVIVACREHFDRAASWYKMRMRVAANGDQLHSPGEFLNARAEDICYAPLIRRIKNAGFRVQALDYQPSDSWAARFLTHIGFDRSKIPDEVSKKQVGPGIKALVATLATNRVVRSKLKRRKYLKAFGKMVESRKAPSFIFDQDAARKAERIFSEDRKFLLAECGIRIAPPDIRSMENMLYIDEAEFADLAEVAGRFGETGDRIVEAARQFVRS